MYFPLLLLLEKAGISLHAEAAQHFQNIMLRDIRLLTPELTEYQAHTLYVGQTPPCSLPCRSEQDTWCILLSRRDKEADVNSPEPSIVSEVLEASEASKVSKASGNNGFSGILPITARENLFVLFNRMLTIMDQFRSWQRQLEQPGIPDSPENHEEKLQEMIRLISGIMGNPAYLTDCSFKAIAIDPTPLFSEISSIWRHLRRYGYLPYDIVYNLQKSGELGEIEQTGRSALFRSAYFNNPFIGYCLKYKGQLYGYLFVVGYRKKITPGEILFAEQLGQAITESVLLMARPASPYGRDYENFFIHALDGNFHDTIQISRQLKPLGWELDGCYCVLRLETALEDETLHRRLCGQLEQLEQVIPLIYDNGVTAVCALDSSHSVTGLILRLKPLLVPLKCCCGISDKFTGFQNLHAHYKQAAAALKARNSSYGENYRADSAGSHREIRRAGNAGSHEEIRGAGNADSHGEIRGAGNAGSHEEIRGAGNADSHGENHGVDSAEKYTVTTYTDCAARCLLQECPKEALGTFRWEVLDGLVRYDRLHHTSYVKTMACYLHCERNLALTSKKLYIHRNTLIYRINRLSRLLDCDLEDAAVRLRLALCLELIQEQE